jgi:hypothetical protein
VLSRESSGLLPLHFLKTVKSPLPPHLSSGVCGCYQKQKGSISKASANTHEIKLG